MPTGQTVNTEIIMQDLPHRYEVNATAEPDGNVVLKIDDVPQLISAPAAKFGGPGDQWSPETLLVGAVLDSFIFRNISLTSKLEWSNLETSAQGVLERVDKVNRFTSFTIRAALTVSPDTDTSRARQLLVKAEAACMIARSLLADIQLEADIIVES
jgi:organic hydroperoxide reductase OsmC/OhrA